ncbi:Endopolyphosphatase [Rhodotorula toruloides]|uniref:BY PROTMAP: gi/472582175/gb/EMS19871.1/ endopolyphosphatase [Rhodosporidium toruloides NP11] gi/647399723/emb/CDR44681.1/ RHTO0S09e07624g1_1 [Rhodosporidium toruloides] n=1 Tax=Rhodotorula toruloides TaxID=5286 RepID=A0A0K3CMH3_RHOTO|nr:Endopolyphosphatase [Rhodotorula toruloides]PRQ71612.1 Metallo-dependent phosphatase-like protein [Rhodotorula toruloides]
MFSSLILPLLLAASSTSSTPLTSATPSPSTRAHGSVAARPLKGRFIHITDVHPDPFYRTGASEDEACHFKEKRKKKKGKGKEGKGSAAGVDGWSVADQVEADEEEELDALVKPDGARDAGYWGLPVSDCDTPLSLVNATFDWLEKHFKGEVDFVVWTGDNARHDIDSRLPRSLPEIFDLNRFVVDRVRSAFGKDVPIVASIGNNDIYPHNVLAPGPNKITSEYLSIWHSFIPEHFLHTFARGGYYSVEAIKGDLLLVSLNTLYFYSRNSIVDGCPPFDEDFAPWRTAQGGANASNRAYLDPSLHPSSAAAASLFQSHVSSLTSPSSSPSSSNVRDIDPGTEQLLWLEQQLTLARARGMQVWLTGHVPATRENWYEGCYQRYAELVLAWQDTVVGQLFGHMNVDFFSFLQDSDTSQPSASSSSSRSPPAPNDLRTLSSSLLSSTYSLYSHLPPQHKTREKDFAPVYVSPSVIPTYLPGVRVWEYNTTGGGREMRRMIREEQDADLEEDVESWVDRVRAWAGRRGKKGRRGGKGKGRSKRPPRNPDRPPRPPRHSSPHAPARKNTYLTPLSYTQYYLSLEALEEANAAAAEVANGNKSETEPPKWELMYTTLSTTELARRLSRQSSSSAERDPLFPSSLLPPPIRTLLSSPSTPSRTHRLRRMLHSLNLTPYDGVLSSGEGLTVKALLRVARWVTEGKKGGKRWEAFRWRMGVGSGEL